MGNKADFTREAINAAAEKHHQEKRFDMPGFRPNVYYVRMMQRYGVLPDGLSLEAPIDYYGTDKAYWDSFRYQPQTGRASMSGGR